MITMHFQLIIQGGEVVIDETLLPEDASTSLSRNLSVLDQSSPIIECEIRGHYIISVDECVEVLQPTRVNCSGIATLLHMHVGCALREWMLEKDPIPARSGAKKDRKHFDTYAC